MLEICRKLDSHSISVITTQKGHEVFLKRGITHRAILVKVPFEERIIRAGLIGLLVIYILRLTFSYPVAWRVRGRHDLILSFSHFLPDTLPAAVASGSDSALVVYVHHLEPPPLERATYHSIWRSFLLWGSQAASLELLKGRVEALFSNVVDSERMKSMNLSTKLIEMSQGIDLKNIGNTKADRTRSYDACYLGRLSASKGIFDLVEIWEKVHRAHPDKVLAIMGGGPGMEAEEKKLRKEVKERQLSECVALLGQVIEPEKIAILKAAKLFLFPSYEEGWGIAVTEAMACGNAVIAYDLPVYRVFQDGIVRVEIGDKEGFANTVCSLFSDSKFRQRVVARAQTIVQEFDWDLVAARETRLYEEFVGRKHAVSAA
jgi:glycosyltransferase involved in cell wall biosynthesis